MNLKKCKLNISMGYKYNQKYTDLFDINYIVKINLDSGLPC